MFEFDLQLFDEKSEEPQSAPETETSEESAEPLPEELSGLPEEYAREVLAEHEHQQTEVDEESSPTEERKTQTPSTVPYDRFKEKVDEANRLKAQLADYQKRQQPQQQQQYQPPQFRITPEISAKITQAIDAEAMTMTGFSQDDVASLEYADVDDPRLAQWAQAKSIAQNRVYNAIQQAQISQQQQQQQFVANHVAATQIYNAFTQAQMKEPDFKAVQNYATNEFFSQLSPDEQRIVASSYLRIERQTASPAEMLVVKNYFERAKAAYRGRNGKSRQRVNQPPQLPRSDQLRGAVSTGDGQLSTREIEKLLEGDFTKIDEKTQKKLLGFT